MVIKAGEVYPSNNCGDMEVIEYVNAREVLVRFIKTGFERYAEAGNIRKGVVKDLLYPSVCGVGYLGIGDYVGNVCRKPTKMYQVWSGMFKRCYDSKYQTKYPTYKGCSVAKEWHNFQVFAPWFNEHYIEGYQLDKDIRIKGNKVYGPDTCMFVTPTENSEAANAVTAVFRSPEGERVEVYNIAKFARDMGLSSGNLSNVNTGYRKSHKGWTLYKEGVWEKPTSTTVLLRSPEGERVEIKNIANFARENGLISSCLSNVKNGNRKHHKGWTLYKEGDSWGKDVLTITFRSPEGEAIEVGLGGISRFARERGLDNSALTKVKNGKAGHHKGWTLWKEEEKQSG